MVPGRSNKGGPARKWIQETLNMKEPEAILGGGGEMREAAVREGVKG